MLRNQSQSAPGMNHTVCTNRSLSNIKTIIKFHVVDDCVICAFQAKLYVAKAPLIGGTASSRI